MHHHDRIDIGVSDGVSQRVEADTTPWSLLPHLGTQLGAFMARDKAHIIAMTGSYFRGDAVPVLAAEDEIKFQAVTYGQHACEVMKVARVYGARPEIYSRASWNALLHLASPGIGAPEIRAARGAPGGAGLRHRRVGGTNLIQA